MDWQLGLATWLNRESKPRANWMASLDFLSCSATASMTVQLLCMLYSCASSGGLPVVSHLRDPVVSPCFNAYSWSFLHTLSHTTLTWFPPKYRVSKCWITRNWHGIKPTKWLIKFNLTISPFGYSVTTP